MVYSLTLIALLALTTLLLLSVGATTAPTSTGSLETHGANTGAWMVTGTSKSSKVKVFAVASISPRFPILKNFDQIVNH